MSAADNSRSGFAGVPPPLRSDAYAAWLERRRRSRARQEAITRNLYTWSSYKNWADKAKRTWEDEPAQK